MYRGLDINPEIQSYGERQDLPTHEIQVLAEELLLGRGHQEGDLPAKKRKRVNKDGDGPYFFWIKTSLYR